MPIVPQAIVFDLLNGGDKDWGRKPPYFDLGMQACEAVDQPSPAGHRRRRLRRHHRHPERRHRLRQRAHALRLHGRRVRRRQRRRLRH